MRRQRRGVPGRGMSPRFPPSRTEASAPTGLRDVEPISAAAAAVAVVMVMVMSVMRRGTIYAVHIVGAKK